MGKRRHSKRISLPFPLKRLAEVRGLSLYEVSRRSGIAREHVSAIANGRTRPGWDTVQVLAQALGASLGEFEPSPAKKRRLRSRLPVVKDGDLCRVK